MGSLLSTLLVCCMMGASTSKKSNSSGFFLKAFQLREIGIVIAIVLVFGLALIKNSSFASTASIQQLLSGPSVVILLAVGETLVIITKNVDLSIGSIRPMSSEISSFITKVCQSG